MTSRLSFEIRTKAEVQASAFISFAKSGLRVSADAINHRKERCLLARFDLTELVVEALFLKDTVPRAIFTQLSGTSVFPASAVIPADLPDFLDKILFLKAVVTMLRLKFF